MSKNNDDKIIKSILLGIVVFFLLMIFIAVFVNRASFQRALKSLSSEYSGGLQRTVTVYDYNGNVIETYEGKIDIEESDNDGKVKFDLDGKRTIIYGGIVVVQEE